MSEFEYLAPRSIEEALNALAHSDGTAIVLAGGTAILPALRVGVIQPSKLFDLHYLDGLKEIRDHGEYIEIGALVPLEAIAQSSLLQQRVAILVEATRRFGNPLIRKSATLGGNLAGVRSPADMAVPLLALDAQLQIRSAGKKQREARLADFLSREVALEAGELITQIRIPTAANGAAFHSWLGRGRSANDLRWFYARLSQRKAGSSSIVSLALIIERKHDKVQLARIALGSVAPKPLRAYRTEASLTDTKLDATSVARCIESLGEEITPHGDITASATYRLSMAQALMHKALRHVSA